MCSVFISAVIPSSDVETVPNCGDKSEAAWKTPLCDMVVRSVTPEGQYLLQPGHAEDYNESIMRPPETRGKSEVADLMHTGLIDSHINLSSTKHCTQSFFHCTHLVG